MKKLRLEKALGCGAAVLACGMLFHACNASVSFPGGTVDVSRRGLLVDVPGVTVDLNRSGLFLDAPLVDIDIRNPH